MVQIDVLHILKYLFIAIGKKPVATGHEKGIFYIIDLKLIFPCI